MRRISHPILAAALLLIALTFFATTSVAQTADPAKSPERVISLGDEPINLALESKLMGRRMPFIVITPPAYAARPNDRFPVIYLLHGLTGHYDNWTAKTKLFEYSRAYNFIIVTPEGENGWYTDGYKSPNDKYESYIVSELIPEIESKFRTRTGRENRFIAGLSMGGYGSIKFGLKYPAMFSAVGSFSGALKAAEWSSGDRSDGIMKSIMEIFGETGSDVRMANDIYRIAREWPSESIKDLPFLYLDCGTEDFLYEVNNEFVKTLREKKIPHEFRELPGKHDWLFWDSQVQEFLRLAARRLPSATPVPAKSAK